MFHTNSERLIGISDAFSAFVYGYPSSSSRAQCTPNKSVPTLRYTRRPGLVYDLVPKGVHENRTKGGENKVDDTLKLVVFLECAQC